MRIKRKQDMDAREISSLRSLDKAGRYLDLRSFNWETSRWDLWKRKKSRYSQIVEIWLSIELTSLHLLRMWAERVEKSEKKSRKKTEKWRESKKKLIKKSTVYQLREFSTVLFLYIKILVSEQGNAACEKLSNCHNLLIMRNDKKDYRNSQHFAFAF